MIFKNFFYNYLYTMNLPLNQTLDKVLQYLNNQGVVVDYNEIHNYILSTLPQNETPKKKTFKIKPKKPNSDKENKPKKIKFKPKRKQNDFQKFVDICNDNNLYYFQFNDENNWKGPSIKIDLDKFDYKIFGDLKIHILEGYGFGILRPTNYECDKKIPYNEINYNQCKLMDEDTLSLEGSEDESYNVYNESTDYEDNDEDEVITEDWTFVPDNVVYQLDVKTNNIYCNQTNQYVGKKIDDFNIDYETKEHETANLDLS